MLQKYRDINFDAHNVRQKHDSCRGRAGNNRKAYFIDASLCGTHRVAVTLTGLKNTFCDNNGVIHQHAYRQHQAHQGQDIQGIAHQVHDAKGNTDREGHREDNNESGG